MQIQTEFKPLPAGEIETEMLTAPTTKSNGEKIPDYLLFTPARTQAGKILVV